MKIKITKKILPEKISCDYPTHTNINQKTKTGQIDDKYTFDLLKQMYTLNRNYVTTRSCLAGEYCINVRSSGLPEDISENIIKFIIRGLGDSTVTWECTTGDLYSAIDGKLECKCFTSNGPISFSPTSGWKSIYFFDAREWKDDKFILYHLAISNPSDIWNKIKMSHTQTFADQCKQGRRPRIGWDTLYPQIKEYITIPFRGSFNQINPINLSTISLTTGTDTALPASL